MEERGERILRSFAMNIEIVEIFVLNVKQFQEPESNGVEKWRESKGSCACKQCSKSLIGDKIINNG